MQVSEGASHNSGRRGRRFKSCHPDRVRGRVRDPTSSFAWQRGSAERELCVDAHFTAGMLATPNADHVANDALRLSITVPDGVEATAKDGNVTLIGTVGYGTELTAAERTVAGLTGVRKSRTTW